MKQKFAIVLVLAAGTASSAQTVDQGRFSAQELLSDASTRLSQSAAAVDAPTMKIGGALQFRYDLNFRDQVPGGNDTTNGFQDRLTTIWATGTVAKDWIYKIQGNFATDGGSFTLEDAYFAYSMGNGWLFGAGQLYFPVVWEDYVDKWQLLAADYSAANSAFRPDRVQGAFFNYTADQWRIWGALDDGAGTANSDYTSSAEADYALTGRGEYKFAGTWDRFADFTSFQNSPYAGKVGGAIHWQSGGSTVGTADMDILLATADVCVEGNGWNAFAAVIYRNIDANAGDSLTDMGLVIQGGFFVAPQWELFGRFDITAADDDRPGEQSDFSAFTFGVNHYIIPESHAAKLTFDISYFPDKQSESIVPASTFTGVLADTEGDQVNIRAQFQLLF